VTGSLKVNPELSIALLEESIEVRIKLEYFQKYGNQSVEVQSDDQVK